MLSILDIRTVSQLITLLLAYFFSIIFASYFQALVAKKMGDDTAEQYGFLSLQPGVYVDWVGFICLFLFSFGWGRVVPINYHNFCGRYRSLKFAFVYMVSAVAHFTLAVIALTSLIGIFGASSIESLGAHTAVSALEHSSYVLALGMVLMRLLLLNLSLAMIRIIFNVVDLVFVFYFDRPAEFIEYRDPYALATILLICIFLGDVIVWGLYKVVALVSLFLAQYILHLI